MNLQSVEIFTYRDIFKAIEKDGMVADVFERNGENRNLFTLFECFTGEKDLFNLQVANNINLAVNIDKKTNFGGKTTVKNGERRTELFGSCEVSFYLFTYQPMKIMEGIKGLCTRCDYFYYVDNLLRLFLKPRGLRSATTRATYQNNLPTIEGVYNATFAISDVFNKTNEPELEFKLNHFVNVE